MVRPVEKGEEGEGDRRRELVELGVTGVGEEVTVIDEEDGR